MKITALFIALTVFISSAEGKKTYKKKKGETKKVETNKSSTKAQVYPERKLPTSDVLAHFTSALPEDTKDGTHSFRQIRSLFFDKNLGYAEIKNLFNQMDVNKDNKISDKEWYEFYDAILEPFQSCDHDMDFTLSTEELAGCLESINFRNIKFALDTPEKILELYHYMDRNQANLIGFLWLRRLNYAWATCSNGIELNANRIYCALTITSPRTRLVIPSEEKAFFEASVILKDGYNWGQRSTQHLLQYVQVAYIFNYFSDYEIQMSEKITKNDVVRAIQDNVLPHWFDKLTADLMFSELGDGLSFPAFAGNYWGIRLFKSQSETLFLNKDNFVSIISSDLVPDRLKDYIEKTYSPTQEEIEDQSKRIFQKFTEKEVYNSYNNIIFMEKKHRAGLMKKSKMLAKSKEEDIDALLAGLEFPADSISLMFAMFDNFRNESIHIMDWNKFLKTSFTYMQLTPNGVQRFNYDFIVESDKYLMGNYNCFPYGTTEEKYQGLLYDWLTENIGYQINMKEYMGWFRLPFGFEYLKQPGLPWRTSIKRTAQAFRDLGFRVSKYNRNMSLMGYNKPLGERNFQVIDAFKIAMQEDSAAYWYKLNKGVNYVHLDFEMGAADPAK